MGTAPSRSLSGAARRVARPLIVLALALGPTTAAAQTTASTLAGVVSDNSGVLSGAAIVASNAASGFKYEAFADDGGAFRLSNLAPGTYAITVMAPSFKPQTRTVQVLVGQTVTLDFRLDFDAVFLENVTVVATGDTQRLIDTRNPEVATNITTEQIEMLPQSSRNFLQFAKLAPGIRGADDESANQVFSSAGQSSRQANVYIDGVSYKNDLLVGGAFMQDSSKGNPFPQNAVQEYKVITQNFKAEYEKASSAVITAVTKSGGNAFHGDVLTLVQNKAMVSLDPISREKDARKPDYRRFQGSFSLGGPIIQSALQFFASYERNDQNRYASVFRGPQYDQAPANVRDRLNAFETGNLLSPFGSNLFFGKVTWQPRVSDRVDVSYSGRTESETRGFGSTRVFEGAEDFRVNTHAVTAKYTMAASSTGVNDAMVASQFMQWAPSALESGSIHENYIGLLDIGGKDSTQDFKQQRLTLRDDATYLLGRHTIKAGGLYNRMSYDIAKQLSFNPTFNYRSDEQWQFPAEVIYGFGDPTLVFSNHQFGLYGQDDWRVGERVTVSAGLRWDYESNMNNNDWVTPPNVVRALRSAQRTYAGRGTVALSSVLDVNRFTTDGTQRTPFTGMIQPRVGMSWDVFGTSRTVIVASVGRYWDRVQLNDILDERFRLDWLRYRVCFSADGSPRGDCAVTTRWDPRYFNRADLDALVRSGNVEGPEVFLLDNDIRPPMTDQWSVGLRQQLAPGWLMSATYGGVRGKNGLSWFFANQPSFSNFNDRWSMRIPINLEYPNGRTYEVAGLFKGLSYRRSRHDALWLTLDRPYDGKWGVNLAYTVQKAQQTGASFAGDGGVSFEIDHVFPQDLTWVPSNFDERHRVIASGSCGLPAGVIASAILTVGSGFPYTIADASRGWDRFRFDWNGARPSAPGYSSLDLRADWTTRPGQGTSLSFIVEAFNLFDWANYSYDTWGGSGFLPPAPEVNATFGQPTAAFNSRRFQLGARFGF